MASTSRRSTFERRNVLVATERPFMPWLISQHRHEYHPDVLIYQQWSRISCIPMVALHTKGNADVPLHF
jgi:hypothetical protein